jgi:hypothetical protein
VRQYTGAAQKEIDPRIRGRIFRCAMLPNRYIIRNYQDRYRELSQNVIAPGRGRSDGNRSQTPKKPRTAKSTISA